MKKLLMLVIIASMFAACNSGPPDDEGKKTIDSLMIAKAKMIKYKNQ